MKILFACEMFWPSVGGAQEVVQRLAFELHKLGHSVTVITSTDLARTQSEVAGATIKDFSVSGNAVRGLSGEVQQYQNFLKTADYDLVIFYAAQQWTFDAALDVLGEIKAKKILIPCGFSGLGKPEYDRYFGELPKYLKLIDHLILLSESYQDALYIREHGFFNYSVIPNGAAYSEFASSLVKSEKKKVLEKYGLSESQFVILHVGSHTGLKGHREAISIFNKAKIPNSVLLIVGNSYSRRCNANCWVASFSSRLRRFFGISTEVILTLHLPRDETIKLFKAADVFLFPSNRECSPIVLFEAAASFTPFLATDVGNSREIGSWTGGGKIIKTLQIDGDSVADIEDGARLLLNLYQSPAHREKLAKAGRKAWEESFTWEKIARRFESLFLNQLG